MSYIIDKNPVNDFINGNLDIWQRGTSFVSPATAYTADRIQYQRSGGDTHRATITQDADVPNGNFNYSCKIDVTTAQGSLGAGSIFIIRHKIEGFNYKKYVGNYGTLGFWVKSNKTGIYTISFRNSGFDRAYVTEFTIDSASTWEYKTCTVLFNEAGGTWDYTNATGLVITIAMASGPTYQTASTDTWLTGNFFASNNQVNGADNTANEFYFSGFTFNVGNKVYSDFSYDYNQELARCQRYAEPFSSGLIGRWNSGTNCTLSGNFLVEKRATPTLSILNSTYTGSRMGVANTSGTIGSISFSTPTVQGVADMSIVVGASGASAADFATIKSVNNFIAESEL